MLFFTKSAGFEHPVIKRHDGKLSFAEERMEQIVAGGGYKITCSKDGRLFDPDRIGQWDAFIFYTTGELTQRGTDGTPPMTRAGKEAFLRAVAGGKGFVGIHCATDTFHSRAGHVSRYVRMIGGEFAGHGNQQSATELVVDGSFPGADAFGRKSFRCFEEWYTFKNVNSDMHAIDVLETRGMKGPLYQRPDYANTWVRMHHSGQVFYTALGHRYATWRNPAFAALLLGGLGFVTRRDNADVKANLKATLPHE